MTGWSSLRYRACPRRTAAPTLGSHVTVPVVARIVRGTPYPREPCIVRVVDRSARWTATVADPPGPSDVAGRATGEPPTAAIPTPAAASATADAAPSNAAGFLRMSINGGGRSSARGQGIVEGMSDFVFPG